MKKRADQWIEAVQHAEALEPIFKIKTFSVHIDRSAVGLVLTFNGILMATDIGRLITWLQENFEV